LIKKDGSRCVLTENLINKKIYRGGGND